MDYWFTSDLHLGHANIIKYCNRPFSSVEEMNAKLIENYNARVKPGDQVFILGDFSFSRRSADFLRCLNGNVHLILGNHDEKNLATLRAPFAWVKPVYYLRAGEHRLWLSHYAHLRWPKSHVGTIHCFGHSHGGCAGYGRSLDVGVDCHDYRPINLDEIVQLVKDKEPTPHHDAD